MDKIKEIWKDGKKRSIIMLGLYFALFTYIFIVYGGRETKVIMPEKIPSKEVVEEITSYEYDYKLDDKLVRVIMYNDIFTFDLDNISYYYINNECYKLENDKFIKVDNPLPYNYDFLGTINDLKDLSTLEKTSNYVATKETEEIYQVDYDKFKEYYKIDDLETLEKLEYSIFYVDSKIEKIIFKDLNLEIDYINFNESEEININYEFYKEGVEE